MSTVQTPAAVALRTYSKRSSVYGALVGLNRLRSVWHTVVLRCAALRTGGRRQVVMIFSVGACTRSGHWSCAEAGATSAVSIFPGWTVIRLLVTRQSMADASSRCQMADGRWPMADARWVPSPVVGRPLFAVFAARAHAAILLGYNCTLPYSTFEVSPAVGGPRIR